MGTNMTLTDFHTFYLGSFVVGNVSVMRPKEVEKFIEEIEYFTKKLVANTKRAVIVELGYNHGNDDIIDRVFGGRDKFNEACTPEKLPLARAAQVFHKGQWSDAFGGKLWADITKTASNLENCYPIRPRTVREVMTTVDRLIDLWHNTALYLDAYCDFPLKQFLDVKSRDYSAKDFTQANSFMKAVYQRWKPAELEEGVETMDSSGRNAIKSKRDSERKVQEGYTDV